MVWCLFVVGFVRFGHFWFVVSIIIIFFLFILGFCFCFVAVLVVVRFWLCWVFVFLFFFSSLPSHNGTSTAVLGIHLSLIHFYFIFTTSKIILQKRNTLPKPICKWGTKGIVMLNTRLRSVCSIVLSKPRTCNGFEQKFLSKPDRNEAFLDTPSENFSKSSQSNDTIILEQNKKTEEDRPEPQFLLFHHSRDNQARVFKTFRGWRSGGRRSNERKRLYATELCRTRESSERQLIYVATTSR